MRISDIFTDEIIDDDIRRMMGKNAPKLPIKEKDSPKKLSNLPVRAITKKQKSKNF